MLGPKFFPMSEIDLVAKEEKCQERERIYGQVFAGIL